MVDRSQRRRARGAASVVLFAVVLVVSVILATTGVHGIVRVLVSVVLGALAAVVTYTLMVRRR